MKATFRRGIALSVALITASCSTVPNEPKQAEMVVVPFEDAAFFPVSPRLPNGPRIAIVWGDPRTGPSAVLLEMKKGAVPLHVHTADYHLVVIEGITKHWREGQSEATARPLGPGSYWFQPGGQAHADACLSEKCVMQIVWSGPRDARLAPTSKR